MRQQVDGAINGLATQINTDPYGFAEKITQETGKVTGAVILGELTVRGGSKLVGAVKGAVTAQRAEAEVLAAARRLVESSGQLEALGEGAPLTVEQLESLGGISRADAAKIQQIIADAKKKFGYDLELQARPSNPYSLEFFAQRGRRRQDRSLQDQVAHRRGLDPRSGSSFARQGGRLRAEAPPKPCSTGSHPTSGPR